MKRIKMPVFRTYFYLFLALVFISSCDDTLRTNSNPKVSYPVGLEQLHQNVLTYYIDQKTKDAKVEELLLDLTEKGAWSTIDYTNKRKSEWPVKNHLKYIQTLAIHYKNEASKFYNDKTLSEKIHKSLNYWLDNDFLSTNWHDQHIGVPRSLLPTLFLIEDELTKQQLKKAMVLLNRAEIKMSGQNKVWLASNVMLRSLLERNNESVAVASNAIQSELKISNGVGVKQDWSYHEHGAQLQFGNYGLWYLEDMIRYYSFVNNTPFQFKKDKIKFLRNYILKGQKWVLWNNSYDVNALGRHFFKDEQHQKAKRLKVCLTQMKKLDNTHSKAYEDALNSKLLSGNKHFWKSDFQVHRRKDFYFSVKMSSQRVIGTESVNQENEQGYYAGDGVALLSVNNSAYQNVFPFWDWKKLPGTTIVQDKKELPIIKFRDFKTNGTFVGGVSNGNNGIAVMDYDRDGVKAKKSWFMFDDKIICLGADISSIKNEQLTTSINQSFFKGNIIINKNDTILTNVKQQNNTNVNWVLHDSIGYYFPKGENVNLSSRILVGSWNNVAKLYRPVLLTDHIFKLWLNHGNQPKAKTYSYVLVPNASKEQMMDLNKTNTFKIINTKSQQSVATLDEKKAGVVFYQKGNSKIKGGISVNKPCVILLEENPEYLDFNISDPTHQLTEIAVIIKGHYNVSNSNFYNGKTEFIIDLPKGEQAGKTVQLKLNKNNSKIK